MNVSGLKGVKEGRIKLRKEIVSKVRGVWEGWQMKVGKHVKVRKMHAERSFHAHYCPLHE